MSELSGSEKKRCAICGREVQARYRPFCSARCADIDLGRWLNESYRIPAKPETEDEEDSPADGRESAGE